IDIGLRPSEIAVIAPYAAQVRWLRDHCEHVGLEVDTVDGFQVTQVANLRYFPLYTPVSQIGYL
ncbi:MAG: hypothetical protein AAF639_46955, partial [Chloroflexota bacterium]